MHIVITTSTADAIVRKLYGAVLAHSLKYAYGLDSTHKRKIDKHGKSGDSFVWKFNNNFVTKSSFHVSA